MNKIPTYSAFDGVKIYDEVIPLPTGHCILGFAVNGLNVVIPAGKQQAVIVSHEPMQWIKDENGLVIFEQDKTE